MTSLERLAKREPTMRLALGMMETGANIVETGCVRKGDDWEGAGQSTIVFGEWAMAHAGHLTTIDIDADNLATAKALTEPYRSVITYHRGDSVAFLGAYAGEPIELLYLDSLDYPYGELLDLYGGKDDLSVAVSALAGMTEPEVVATHQAIIEPSQRHARLEILAALPHLAEQAVVLIDDADLPGGGKARLARTVLEANGFTCVLDAYQTLWVRP